MTAIKSLTLVVAAFFGLFAGLSSATPVATPAQPVCCVDGCANCCGDDCRSCCGDNCDARCETDTACCTDGCESCPACAINCEACCGSGCCVVTAAPACCLKK